MEEYADIMKSLLKILFYLTLFGFMLFAQTLPTFHISYQISLPKMVSQRGMMKGEAFKISVWESVQELWQRGAQALAVMIAGWSGVLPLLKVTLLLIDNSRINYGLYKLGKLAYFDVYALYTITLALRISDIRGCTKIQSMNACSHLGFMYSEPMYGLLFLLVGISMINIVFYMKIRRDAFPLYKESRLYFLGNVLSILFMSIGSFLPMLALRIKSTTNLIQISPKKSTISLVETFISLVAGTTKAPIFNTLPAGGTLISITGFVAVTTVLIPLTSEIIAAIVRITQNRHTQRASALKAINDILIEWNHIGVFVVGAMIVASQITHLTEEFGIPSEVADELGLKQEDLPSSMISVRINFLIGFYFLMFSAFLSELTRFYGTDFEPADYGSLSDDSEEIKKLKISDEEVGDLSYN